MEESQMVDLSFAEGATETLYVTQLTPTCFRLRETPVTGPEEEELYLGDVIEVELRPDGTYYFVRVVERAPMRHYSWIVPEFFVKSPQYGEYGAAVEAAGGAWEGLMNCWLLVHVPTGSTFDADGELDRSIAAANRQRRNNGGRSGRETPNNSTEIDKSSRFVIFKRDS